MKKTISTIDVRKQLGEILDRVSLRYDEFIIERKGKALAAVVPIEKLEQLERAARGHLLALMARQPGSISQSEADRIANEAKHESRRGTL
ncbi:MAG TPA: type II toxin-antitoxin system Phd/YefM family antitoxin [Vicinamibacteria bacterium]|nr:type II toxin-antitoxin system Phd/YefM family antitoxin [Vicinamibacteria bacterium]